MNFEQAYNQIDGVDGWFNVSQAKAIYPYIAGLKPGSLLVEIGTFHGRSTKFFSAVNPDIKILTIDLVVLPEGNAKTAAQIDREVLESGQIFQVLGDSCEVIKGFNWDIDFLFIDGDHEYPAVRKDIDNWLPRVKTGGLVGFHDYEITHLGVVNAVDETQELTKLVDKDGICVCRK